MEWCDEVEEYEQQIEQLKRQRDDLLAFIEEWLFYEESIRGMRPRELQRAFDLVDRAHVEGLRVADYLRQQAVVFLANREAGE